MLGNYVRTKNIKHCEGPVEALLGTW